MGVLTAQRMAASAYRTLGLPASATQAQIDAAARRLRIWADPKTVPPTPWDTPWLGPVRRSRNDIEQALSALNEPATRVEERLLWFHRPEPALWEAQKPIELDVSAPRTAGGASDLVAEARAIARGIEARNPGARVLASVVDPKDLAVVGSTQPEIFSGTVDAMAAEITGPDPGAFWAKSLQADGPIEIWEIGRQRYLYNGNHRFQAALKAQRPIPMENIRIVSKPSSQIPTFTLENQTWLPGTK
jgi:hypothetical protein